MDLVYCFFSSFLFFILSNFYFFYDKLGIKCVFFLFLIYFIFISFFPDIFFKKLSSRKLCKIRKGYFLLLMYFVLVILYSISFFLICFVFKYSWGIYLFVYLLCLFLVYWNGFFRVYLNSSQLAIRYRGLFLFSRYIPFYNFYMLAKVISITRSEVIVENDRILLNDSRRDLRVCSTKYPILLVHGVFFRDFRFFDYWGRIPNDLKENGATIYYGNHSSALPVSLSASEIASRIHDIVSSTGCGKVNIIAHSKGGLDCRYAISELGISKYVASLTMINTPNRGCEFADYLLSKVPQGGIDRISRVYNSTLKCLGDESPDFIGAVNDLTSSSCSKLNSFLVKSDDVFYQSVGSKLVGNSSGRFPLNMTSRFVNLFDGPNDGLVGENSFSYGDNYMFVVSKSKRGISHGDMIDLNRENFSGFDVREFYVKIVSDLKKRGF